MTGERVGGGAASTPVRYARGPGRRLGPGRADRSLAVDRALHALVVRGGWSQQEAALALGRHPGQVSRRVAQLRRLEEAGRDG